ncbi:MAG: aspartate 1-decarboxylase [Candidatus Omnitrophica bacterium]|nr:aspartate 1-decarboxylase [Candidatus Omnitrophota bacterium]
MQIILCKSKIRGATVTRRNLYYEGSITLDKNYIEKAGILPGEMVYVLNLNNGARVFTYVIAGRRGSGTVCINGAAARLFEVGDPVIILSLALIEPAQAKHYSMKVVTIKNKHASTR